MKDLLLGERAGFVNFYERNSDGTLKSGKRIHDANGEIKVHSNSSVVVVDWNEDGKLDLLVGSGIGTDGIRLYLNSGSTTNYRFTTFSKLELNGNAIAYNRCYIQVEDLDRDGKKDLITCEGMANSKMYFMKNVGTNAAPIFTSQDTLKLSNGTIIDPESDPRFCFTDWNEDGLFDMIWSERPSVNPHIMIYLGQNPTPIKSNKVHREISSSLITVKDNRLSITININGVGEKHLNIFSSKGLLLYNRHIHQVTSIHVDISNFASGVYFIQLYGSSLRNSIHKIILNR